MGWDKLGLVRLIYVTWQKVGQGGVCKVRLVGLSYKQKDGVG